MYLLTLQYSLQQRREFKRVGAESCDFQTDSCKFLTEEIWVLKISILLPNFPKMVTYSRKFSIVFLIENVSTG